MEAIAAIGVSAVALALAIGLVLAVRWVRAEVTLRGEAQALANEEAKQRGVVERERDDERAAKVRTTVELEEARAQAAVYAKAARDAREELSKHVRERLATGTDDDVLAEVRRLLGPELPAVRPAAEATSNDRGGPEAAPVHPPG